MRLLSQSLRLLFGASTCHNPAKSFRPRLQDLEGRCLPSVTLGTAATYGVLALQNTSVHNAIATVSGDVGVSQGGNLRNMPFSTITGNVNTSAQGQYAGRGTLGGTLNVNPALLAQNDSDALNAASQAANLTATQSVGTIRSATTVTGNGGLNVIQVNGDIKSSLILNGTASDVFIVNVTGTLRLFGSSTLGLGGGVTPDHVLYNFTGAGGNITTHGNVLNGTLLGLNYNFSVDGVFNGEIIGGGGNIRLLPGAQVNEMPFSPPAATASLSGVVYNPSFTGVGGATVTITDANNNMIAQTTTHGDGSYSFSNLAAGVTYTISATPPPGDTADSWPPVTEALNSGSNTLNFFQGQG